MNVLRFSRLPNQLRRVTALSLKEWGLLAGLLLLGLVAVASPALRYDTGLLFADARHWHGVPNAMDVFSNLPFAVLGGWGLWHVKASKRQPTVVCAELFFIGLLVTALGSTFYHLHPDIQRLAGDRAGMTVAFAGLIGLAVADRVSRRAAWPTAWLVLAAGLLAAFVHQRTGNVVPWALVQFGGMALVVALALLRPVGGDTGLRLFGVIAFYAVAKGLEMGDHVIFDATHHVISGHSLKHMVAALAALPVLAAIKGTAAQSAPSRTGAQLR